MTAWSVARRKRASERAKAHWERTPEGIREQWMGAGRQAYAVKYPERAALSARTRAAIADGSLVPGLCADCGRPDAAPEFDYERLELAGWSHYDCRKARLR